MTREGAIRELKIQFVGEYDRQREAKDMAIKALEQEPCEDAVSKEDVLAEIIRFSTEEGASVECQQLYCDVNNMPSVTPQEPILDKIRAEIAELDIYYDNDYFSDNKDAMFKCNEILRVLDKYKAESKE